MTKFISSFAIVALLASTSIISTAQAAGFSALDDTNKQVVEQQEQSAKNNVKPVLIGDAAIVAAIQKFESLQVVQAIKTVVEIKNQITATIQGFDKSIRSALGIEKREAERDEKLAADIINNNAAGTMAELGGAAALAEAEYAAARALQEANTEVAVRGKYQSDLSGWCIAQGRGEISDNAGAIREPVRGRGTGPIVTAGTGGSGGGDDAKEKPLKDTASKHETEIENEAAEEIAAKSNADLGAPGAAGPLSWYNDIAQAVLGKDDTGGARYITDQAWLGAGEKLDIKGIAGNPKAGMDMRTDQLMSDKPIFSTYPCTNETADGKFILSSAAMRYCSEKEDERWEKMYADKAVKPLDLASAYLIRDYMLPAPFSPFSLNFLKRVQGNDNGEGDLAARELFAKTRRLLSSSNLLASVFNSQIASRTPQSFGEDKEKAKKAEEAFAANWEKVYGVDIDKPIHPSARVRRDVEVEAYRSTNYLDQSVAEDNAAHMATQTVMLGELSGLQKDTLYALERIEMLLAAMLSNDLEDRRDALEARVRSGASN